MDELNKSWLKGKPNFYFLYKRSLLESMITGSCLNVGCGSHIIEGATNIDSGLPDLPYADNSFDTVICSDVLEHIGPHKQAIAELLRVARKKIIITVPACKWLYGEYDRLLGHKRRYSVNDFSGFEVTRLFWFLMPILILRKLFNLKHRPLPNVIDAFFLRISRINLWFGTTILAVKYKDQGILDNGLSVSLFIPIFNEERIIERDIKTVNHIISKARLEYEIFIVNDASCDKTRIIAEGIERSNKRIKLLNYEVGPTRRENLAESFKKAGGQIVIFIDVDLISSLRFMPDLIAGIIDGYDIVTGSRYIKGAKIKRRPFRLLISLIYNWFIRVMFHTTIGDHMCGFKAFRKDILLGLVEEMGYDASLKRGVFWDTELLIRAIRHGYKIKEIPIWWNERNKSALSFRREVKAIIPIFKFYFQKKGLSS